MRNNKASDVMNFTSFGNTDQNRDAAQQVLEAHSRDESLPTVFL